MQNETETTAGDGAVVDEGAPDAAAAGAGDQDGHEPQVGPPPKKRRWQAGRRQWMAIGGATLLIASAGSAVAYLTAGDNSHGGVTIELGGPYTLHELPMMVTDLQPTGTRLAHVRIKTLVELPEGDVSVLQANEARIVDEIKGYLRERRRGDLSGQLGTDRLRSEIRTIVNRHGGDGRVRDVLFRELVVD